MYITLGYRDEVCRIAEIQGESGLARSIHLPNGSMLKVKAKQKERALRLSFMDRTAIGDLFQATYPLPEFPAFERKMMRLSSRNLDGAPVNYKKFRKTWENGWCSIIQARPCRLL